MITSQSLAGRPLGRREPAARFLRVGFWLLSFALALHLLLVVLPAYGGGLVPAYLAGQRLKDMDFDIPVYTSYFLIKNLLFFPVLLLIAFVKWAAPVLTAIWGLVLIRSWQRLPVRTMLGCLAILLPLWCATLLTTHAAAAFSIWLLD